MWMVLLLASRLILTVGSASAETSFLYDSGGGSAMIISPGDGSMSFYYGSDGTTGTIIRPGGGGTSFYDFNRPDGQQSTGTILTVPSPPSPRPLPPPLVAPLPPLFPAPAPPRLGNPPAPPRWPDRPR
jgi:hypothetical protein